MISVEELLAVGGDRTRRGLFNIESIGDDVLGSLLDELGALVQQQSEVASDLLSTVVAEATRRDLPAIEARGAYLWARAEVNQGRLGSALDLIDRSRSVWLAHGSPVAAWRTDLGRMHILDDLGRHADAVDVGEALIAHLDQVDVTMADPTEVDWLRAAGSENLGVSRGYLGEHEAALSAYLDAEETYRRLGMMDDVARPMGNRGVELIELGRPVEALEALGAAAARFEALDDRLSAARCLAYQARAHVLAGSYLGAAAATQRAHAFLSGQETSVDYARIELVRAQTMSSLNLLDEAFDVYESIIPYLCESGLEHDLADAVCGRAAVLARAGRTDEARTAFREAERRYGEVGATSMAAIARLGLSELIEPDEAHELAVAATVELERSGRVADHAAGLIRLAQLATTPDERGRLLDSAKRLLDGSDLPHLQWRERHERGRLLVSIGDRDGAQDALDAALTMIDDLRSTVPDEHHRLPFMAGRDQVRDDLLHLLLDTGDLRGAYALTERARARTLVERLSGELSATAVTPSSSDLDDLYTTMLRAPGLAASHLQQAARVLERSSRREVRRQPVRPAGVAVDGGGPSIPVVTYQTLGNEIAAFVEQDGELGLVRGIADAQVARNLLDRLDAQWRRFDDPGLVGRQHDRLLASTLDLLQELHIGLLAPLAGVLDSRQLIVVPCEPLANAPFAAFHDGTCHLVERLAVTIAPSLSVARLAGARQRTSLSRRLVVGVSDESIPEVEVEISAIGALSPDTTILRDEEATIAAVEALAPSHDVLHFACHGIHRPDNPLFSALRLGDRWLTVAEIARLRLDGQLVVLSACSSGRQKVIGTGDELVGLPRAFLAAGAGTVVVNLWPVADALSATLMTSLHRELQHAEPAEALRRAQLDLMNEQPHPYYWSPAVVFGAPRSKEST